MPTYRMTGLAIGPSKRMVPIMEKTAEAASLAEAMNKAAVGLIIFQDENPHGLEVLSVTVERISIQTAKPGERDGADGGPSLPSIPDPEL